MIRDVLARRYIGFSVFWRFYVVYVVHVLLYSFEYDTLIFCCRDMDLRACKKKCMTMRKCVKNMLHIYFLTKSVSTRWIANMRDSKAFVLCAILCQRIDGWYDTSLNLCKFEYYHDNDATCAFILSYKLYDGTKMLLPYKQCELNSLAVHWLAL